MESLTSLADIQALMCDVVQSITGWPTVQGDQDAPTPKGSYIVLRVTDNSTPVHDIVEGTDTATGYTETVRGQSYCKAEFIVIGTGAMDTARKAISGLQSGQRAFDLWQSIGLCGFDSIQNLSEEYGGQFRQKMLFNMYFYANLTYSSTVDYYTTGAVELTVPPLYDHTFTPEG